MEENTIIIFTSDNGPSYRGSTGGLTGGKTDLREGGIRVPYLVSWPGKIEPSVNAELVSTIDILPTVADLIDVDITLLSSLATNKFIWI
ncbi:MAG: sulfatase-like hydrolase/transferase [Ekhidna sp.]|nr:sulfatase-like hydrolase/transferase [Ekhidna sp.]